MASNGIKGQLMPATADITTRCPQCGTAFRATIEVLNVANGAVRCGSCLWVFNAHEFDIDKDKENNADSEDESWALDLLKEEEENEAAEEKEKKASKPKVTSGKKQAASKNEAITAETLDTPSELDMDLSGNIDLDRIDLDRVELHDIAVTDETPQVTRWPWALGATVGMLVLILPPGLSCARISSARSTKGAAATLSKTMPCRSMPSLLMRPALSNISLLCDSFSAISVTILWRVATFSPTNIYAAN
jgi:predicted Zn finger-like uncharacterized protein